MESKYRPPSGFLLVGPCVLRRLSPLTQVRGSERTLATGKGHDSGFISGVGIDRELRG